MRRLVLTLYRLIIHLYPRPFQESFGDEMLAVFAARLTHGNMLWSLCHEVFTLPGSLMVAYAEVRMKTGYHILAGGLVGVVIAFVFNWMGGFEIPWSIFTILTVIVAAGAALLGWLGYRLAPVRFLGSGLGGILGAYNAMVLFGLAVGSPLIPITSILITIVINTLSTALILWILHRWYTRKEMVAAEAQSAQS
jgi:hypothetical protein